MFRVLSKQRDPPLPNSMRMFEVFSFLLQACLGDLIESLNAAFQDLLEKGFEQLRTVVRPQVSTLVQPFTSIKREVSEVSAHFLNNFIASCVRMISLSIFFGFRRNSTNLP